MTVALRRSAAADITHSAGYSASAPTEQWALVSNRLQKRDGTLPLVLFAHGGGQTVAATSSDTTSGKFALEIARRGLPVLVCDLGGLATFAADPARDRVRDAIAYARSTLGCSLGPLIGVGISMGFTLIATDFYLAPTDYLCTVGIEPLINTERLRAENLGGNQAAVESAYGGNAAWQVARPTHAAWEFPAAFVGKPTHVWCGTGDPLCLLTDAHTWAAASGATVTEYFSTGHATGNCDPNEVADWIVSQVAA